VRYVLIVMAQHIADAGHLWPGDASVPRLQCVGQAPAGFRDDFNAALDEPAIAPVGQYRIEFSSAQTNCVTGLRISGSFSVVESFADSRFPLSPGGRSGLLKFATALLLATADAESILRRFTKSNIQHPTLQGTL
jgi:hypothetical protein